MHGHKRNIDTFIYKLFETAYNFFFNITVFPLQWNTTDVIDLFLQPVSSEESEGTLRLVKFERTPIMSTYLVAVVVGEFDYVEDVSGAS